MGLTFFTLIGTGCLLGPAAKHQFTENGGCSATVMPVTMTKQQRIYYRGWACGRLVRSAGTSMIWVN
jgi:hypothetical protein